MNRRLFPALLLAPVLAIALVSSVALAPAQAAHLPSKRHWVKDTRKAMRGSRAWIDTRVARPKPTDGRLAVNLDIDNTSLATTYARGKAVAVTLRFVRHAKAHGVAILFNTGRLATQLSVTAKQLRAAGYPVDAVCARQGGEGVEHSKQRCRSEFVAEGYTLIANVGNHSTDFTGGDYERAFRLPNYHNRLG